MEKALAQFFRWAFDHVYEGYEIDAADLQDKAHELGLVVKEPYDPIKHGESEFDNEPGDDWYVLAPELHDLLKEPGQETTGKTAP